MNNPIKALNRKERLIWILSLAAVSISNIFLKNVDILTFAASLIGVTSLIFAAKGNVFAQLLMILFCILYGIISWRFRYWGEMITYLCMSLPMSVWSFITWIRNPSEKNKSETAIRRLSPGSWILLSAANCVVTGAFYYILKALGTPNLLFSTFSVATSFFAALLMMMRSSYYALAYTLNDVVLIVLWILASFEDSSYIPVAVNFAVFLVNDIYGFISWKKREHS